MRQLRAVKVLTPQATCRPVGESSQDKGGIVRDPTSDSWSHHAVSLCIAAVLLTAWAAL